PSRSFAERYDNLIAVGGHPSVDMPPHVVEAAARAAERPAYAPTRGAPALREAIAALHDTTAESVLVTVGGMQGLYLVAQVYGARTVSHAPSFFFPQIVEAVGGTSTIAYGWDEYAASVRAGATLAIVNTPVNPDRVCLPAGRSRRDRRGGRGQRSTARLRRGVLRTDLRRARAPLSRLASGAA